MPVIRALEAEAGLGRALKPSSPTKPGLHKNLPKK